MTVKCAYAGSEGAGIEAEVEEGGGIYCTADADVVVRIEGQMPARKTPVCREHSIYLRTSEDVEINWEQCGEDPSYFDSFEGGSE